MIQIAFHLHHKAALWFPVPVIWSLQTEVGHKCILQGRREQKFACNFDTDIESDMIFANLCA